MTRPCLLELPLRPLPPASPGPAVSGGWRTLCRARAGWPGGVPGAVTCSCGKPAGEECSRLTQRCCRSSPKRGARPGPESVPGGDTGWHRASVCRMGCGDTASVWVSASRHAHTHTPMHTRSHIGTCTQTHAHMHPQTRTHIPCSPLAIPRGLGYDQAQREHLRVWCLEQKASRARAPSLRGRPRFGVASRGGRAPGPR